MLRTYLSSIISSGEALAKYSWLSRGVLPLPYCAKSRVRRSSFPMRVLLVALATICAKGSTAPMPAVRTSMLNSPLPLRQS